MFPIVRYFLLMNAVSAYFLSAPLQAALQGGHFPSNGFPFDMLRGRQHSMLSPFISPRREVQKLFDSSLMRRMSPDSFFPGRRNFFQDGYPHHTFPFQQSIAFSPNAHRQVNKKSFQGPSASSIPSGREGLATPESQTRTPAIPMEEIPKPAEYQYSDSSYVQTEDSSPHQNTSPPLSLQKQFSQVEELDDTNETKPQSLDATPVSATERPDSMNTQPSASPPGTASPTETNLSQKVPLPPRDDVLLEKQRMRKLKQQQYRKAKEAELLLQRDRIEREKSKRADMDRQHEDLIAPAVPTIDMTYRSATQDISDEDVIEL